MDSVLKPKLDLAVRQGIPLSQVGAAFLGYGVRICRTAGLSPDEIRGVIEAAITGKEPDPATPPAAS